MSVFAEREGLATSQTYSLLRLTPFPRLADRLPARASLRKSLRLTHLFISNSRQTSLRALDIKKEVSNFFNISLLRSFCGKRGIRTPGTVARTPHFECGPIDHSGTFPCPFCGANVRINFVIPTIWRNILHFFCVSCANEYDFTNICVIFAYTK